MIEVGTIKARTHLSTLLDKVAQGDEVTITRRGRPVARLVPVTQAVRIDVENTIESLRALRTGVKLNGLDWRSLRAANRR